MFVMKPLRIHLLYGKREKFCRLPLKMPKENHAIDIETAEQKNTAIFPNNAIALLPKKKKKEKKKQEKKRIKHRTHETPVTHYNDQPKKKKKNQRGKDKEKRKTTNERDIKRKVLILFSVIKDI